MYWPSSLPNKPLSDGYSLTLPDNVLLSEFDAGPPKSRRRYTAVWETHFCRYLLTGRQYQTLIDFYKRVAGTSFYWPHPLTGTLVQAYMDKPPELTRMRGTIYQVSVVIRTAP